MTKGSGRFPCFGQLLWYSTGMSVGALVSLDEYLKTSYDPDLEYVDGVLEERNSRRLVCIL